MIISLRDSVHLYTIMSVAFFAFAGYLHCVEFPGASTCPQVFIAPASTIAPAVWVALPAPPWPGATTIKECGLCDPKNPVCTLEDCTYSTAITNDKMLEFKSFHFWRVVFEESVDLSNRKLTSLDAQGCLFLKDLSLENSEVEGSVQIVKSLKSGYATEIKGRVNLIRLKAQFVDLEGTFFRRGADLSDMEIRGELAAREARFEGALEDNDWASLSVEKTSAARMDFSKALIEKGILAASAITEKGGADFYKSVIGGKADFDFLQVKTELRLVDAEIGEFQSRHASGDLFSFIGADFRGQIVLDDAGPRKLDLRDVRAPHFSLRHLKIDQLQIAGTEGKLDTRGLQAAFLQYDDWQATLEVLRKGGADVPAYSALERSLRDRGMLRDANRARHVVRRCFAADYTSRLTACVIYDGVANPILYLVLIVAIVLSLAALLAHQKWTTKKGEDQSADRTDHLLHAISVVLPGDLTGFLDFYKKPSAKWSRGTLMAFQLIGLFLATLLVISVAALIPR